MSELLQTRLHTPTRPQSPALPHPESPLITRGPAAPKPQAGHPTNVRQREGPDPRPLGEETAPGEEGVARGKRLLSIPLKGVHLHPRRPPATAAVRPGWFRVCRGGQEKVSSNPRTEGGSASLGEGPGGHPWVDTVMVVTQERAREGAPEMDVVMVVTQGRAREDTPGWTWSPWSPRGGPGGWPWVDVPWANTEHGLALLSGGWYPEGPWPAPCTDRMAGSLGRMDA